jgi:hypothetical protein
MEADMGMDIRMAKSSIHRQGGQMALHPTNGNHWSKKREKNETNINVRAAFIHVLGENSLKLITKIC